MGLFRILDNSGLRQGFQGCFGNRCTVLEPPLIVPWAVAGAGAACGAPSGW